MRASSVRVVTGWEYGGSWGRFGIITMSRVVEFERERVCGKKSETLYGNYLDVDTGTCAVLTGQSWTK